MGGIDGTEVTDGITDMLGEDGIIMTHFIQTLMEWHGVEDMDMVTDITGIVEIAGGTVMVDMDIIKDLEMEFMPLIVTEDTMEEEEVEGLEQEVHQYTETEEELLGILILQE